MDLREPWSDAELMSRVRGGERSAFEILVDRYKDRLVSYLTRLTRSRDRAEELAQEAFVRLYQTSNRYREQGQLQPYLFRIATNLLISEQRRAKRWSTLFPLFSYAANNGHQAGSTPQGQLLRLEEHDRVAEALAALPVRYRAPLVLREVEGWSYHDIATALGVREGTIKSRISRGKERLRRLLAPYFEGAS
jgi:RNA polymerase sigma-70 factor (ECF subfamily)